VDRLREMVRIAGGLDRGKNLDAASQERALACLARFGERLRDIPAERVRVAGTNTLRKARHAAEFLEQAEEFLGHEIDIVSGIEEARLIFIGVSHSLPDVGGEHLVIDIGGGSTELAGGLGSEPQWMESLAMGCVGFSRKYFADGKISRKRFDKARAAVRLELRPVAGFYRSKEWQRVAGASGTIRTVASIMQEMGLVDSRIELHALEKLIDVMINQGHADRLDLPGLSEQRAPVIAGGVAILVEIMNQLEIKQLVAAQGALREGIIYDLAGRLRDEDSRTLTVRAMESRYHVDAEQAARVELTAVSMLDQVADGWKIDRPSCRLLLAWAARLHEIGLDIAHGQYHRHGAYLLEHADMPGFNQSEQSVLACLVGSHRRKFSLHYIAQIAPKNWVKRTQRLAILLRVAVLFNRSRSYEFPDVLRLSTKGKQITLCLPKDWLEANPLTLADLEREQSYLESAGYELKLVPLDATATP